jgi:ABC-type bacteriocin/lantibiotic exporter with double-glycine peptidase domain
VRFTTVFQSLIKFATNSYIAHREGIPAPGIGKGIGSAIALVVLQLIASLCQHHFFYRAISTGVLLRGGLITAIYSRSLRLTTRARATLPNGKLVNHISTDVSRIDFCCGAFHIFLASPIQLAICLALLISNLGPSALAGFSVFFILTPILGRIMKTLISIRQKTMVWTDKRAKLLQELLGGMKLIKFFAWENPFLDRIGGYRKREMR